MNTRSKPRGRRSPGRGRQATRHYTPFSIDFGDGRTARAVRVPPDGDAARAIAALALEPGKASVFVSGGAGGMSPDEMDLAGPLIADGLTRFAHDYGVAIVDGGTESGIMKLTGDARRERACQFPLVGVAPLGAVGYPGREPEGAVPLDGGHSHFVLVDAPAFGDESDMLIRVARALAGTDGAGAFGLIVNGGEITRQETYERAVEPETTTLLLVVEGSGRFGDELARGARGLPVEDTRIPEILAHADVRLVPAADGPERFYAELERLVE